MTIGELKTVLLHLPDDMEIGIGILKKKELLNHGIW